MKPIFRSTAGVLAAVIAGPLLQADNLGILEVKQGSAATTASTHGMAPVKPLRIADQAVWKVSGSGSDLTADPSVKSYEEDRADIKPSESSSQSSATVQVTGLIPFVLQRGTVMFAGTPVRVGYPDQPAAVKIGIDAARTGTPGGAGITVAIIDTGVDPKHPALSKVLVPGYDFLLNQAGSASELAGLNQSTVALLDQSTVALLDQKYLPAVLNQSTVALLDQSTVALLDRSKLGESFGHGTMVAGLVHLVAPSARIMPLRAFKSDGTGQLSDIVAAIYYAADHGANVVNMSFSFDKGSPSVQSALAYARSKGVLCIGSAGNQGREKLVFPAGYEATVIGVGSSSLADLRSKFSNYDASSVHMAAPGEALLTTYPGNNYAVVWGTSFSTALVAGAGAALGSMGGAARISDLRDSLSAGAPLPGQDLGEGRLDLGRSIAHFRSAISTR